ncbi:hypothetical protein L3Q82_004930 [Scortum barcoo]|uniref:Uncharacterized protein n=1 Tax=Scortum barcoo TaxID=214431 RepID=A0ACB8VGM0_9TELE|nr:hypothetical protein L3Q82_004930 [Scortum barcoo]
MSGQSITDRITAAQHSVTGSAVSKTVCKATTHEVMGPKKKHLDYLIHCTNEMNVNIPQLADSLFERTTNTSWVVVFKSLITTHHLMVYGNERFVQYLASRNTLFNLSNFLDKSGLQGYDMSTFIRRYSRYLNEKAVSYRQVAFDFTKVKRGVDGVMRTMNTEKLLKTIPIIQNQMDALLDFNVNANELTNGVINAAFMLLFKDSIRLFAAYNEGIINLLEKYFDMKKTQCKEGLDIYKKFLTRMTRISEFLKVAEQVGIDRGDIPDLSQFTVCAPSSLLEALEQHLASLEGKKVKDSTAASRASTLSNAVSSLASTGMSFTKVDEREKQAALEEEQARLKALKEQRLKELSKKPSFATTDTSPISTTGGTISTAPAIDLFSTPSCSNGAVKMESDLFDLQSTFQPSMQSGSTGLPVATAWADSFCGPVSIAQHLPHQAPFPTEPSTVAGLFRACFFLISYEGYSTPQAPPQQSAGGLQVDFESVFGAKATGSNSLNSDDISGGILKPTLAGSNQPSGQQPEKLVSDDLDSSLANLVGNLGIGNGTMKNDIHWSQPGEKRMTGGTNWQPKAAPTTTWNPVSMPPSVMAFPATTPTGMMAYGMPPQMGSMGMMNPPTMMYSQPVMRPPNPFGSVSSAQRLHNRPSREAGGGTMIDLSHLTEEEQGVIMTVLRRDAELKKAEEERIRNLEKILNSGSESDIKRKYLTGEWFYEAKSRRHMDKIHGSEIILASMKQRKAGLDRNPRNNPFNRASLIVVEQPENNNDMSASRDQESSETEPISPLKSPPAGEASQTSGGSVTSEGSSVGFRPVPKKRTFLSRRTSSQSESNGSGLEAQGASAGVVPAPRRSLQRGSSGSSNQSYIKGQDETPQTNVVANEVSQPAQPAQPSKSLENSHQPPCDVSQLSSNSSLERERNPPSLIRDRSVDDSSSDSHPKVLMKLPDPSKATHNLHNFRQPTYTRSDASINREIPQKIDEGNDETQRKCAASNTIILHPGSIQDSDRENSVGTAMRREDLSLPQSTVDPDPPVSYDLNFIDKSDDQLQNKSNQKHVFKLSTQTTSPTGDEDSIAKVLDWFSRSTDSSDWLNTEDSPETAKIPDKRVEISKLRGEDSSRKDAGDITSDRKKETLELKRGHLQRHTNESKELGATDRIGHKEPTETQKEDTGERMRSQKFEDNNDESQPPQISHLKSFWEKSNMGPKILISKSITPREKGHKPAQLSAEKDEEKVNKPNRVSDMPSVLGIYNDTKGSFSFDKPKSPKRKEPIGSQLPSQELKCGDPEVSRAPAAFEKTRPVVMKSPTQNRSKSPHDRQSGSRGNDINHLSNYTTAEQQRESKRSSKDSNREEKSTKPQSSSGKEARSPKNRKDSFSNSSSRANSMRRATSMFSLSAPDEKDQMDLKIDVSPVHSQSRKQRQNTEKGAMPRRSSEETETLTPRARAYVPIDYRHYLGMTDKTSVHTSLAPALQDEGSEGKSGYDFDLGGPMRASTPMNSEERYSRKGTKISQRPLWATYSSSDTGENDDDDRNPVRKALRRAEARPKNLAKSMEDITASLSPRQERRQDPTADMRRISDVSSIPSPSSSLFSDPDHLKKMSKSVPLFLQKEDFDRDSDSNYEDSDHRGRLMMGSSLTNLTGSSGMASVSSLSGSVMTMYSGDFGNVEVQGNIQFSINYIQRLREFHIFVAECRDLAVVDPKRGRSDPYVKSYLVPDKANLGKRKTSVKKKTLNPTFNEILRYRVRMEYLRTQTLILSVWHHDTFGRNSFLGEVDVDLSKWDFDHTQMNYLALKARTTPTLAPSNDRGEMRVSIRFLPQIIHSEVSCRISQHVALSLLISSFVLPDTSRKSRQKTRVLRRTVDPAFNHTMVYDGIREADLSEACVELTVWDRDRLASNLLGGLRLGAGTGRSYGAVVDWMDSTPYEVALWERMKATPNEWVEDILPLRVLNSAKTAFK